MAATAAAVPVWEPPSGPLRPYRTAEACGGCQEPLWATAGGTWRACLTCKAPVTPPAVQAPYERGVAASQRQVKTRAELEAEEFALDDRKGPMLDQLDELLDGGELDTASVRKVGRIRERVEKAESDARLDELVEQFQRAGIRRRSRWHVQPAAELDSGASDYDDDGDGQDDDDGDGRAAIGPAPAGGGYAAALAARNWILKPHGPGVCHVVRRGWDGSPDPCARAAGRVIPGGAVCDHHDQALITPLNRRNA